MASSALAHDIDERQCAPWRRLVDQAELLKALRAELALDGHGIVEAHRQAREALEPILSERLALTVLGCGLADDREDHVAAGLQLSRTALPYPR